MSVFLSSQRSRALPWRGWLGATSGLNPLLVGFLGAALLLRVLTDDLSAPDSRHSGSLNLSGGIAVLLILVAGCLLLRRRRGVLPTVLTVLWLCIWMAIAVNTSGTSIETLREGVREVSVVALAVIVYNVRGVVTVPIATRLVQLVCFAPALIALYQLATHTGMDVAHNLRANGTFAHPNSAAMFFAIAAIASLWQYLDNGRHRYDALLMTLFATALIATFSIDGLITLVAMLTAFGALRPGSLRVKLGPCAIAGVVVLVFFATPLGSQRVAGETSTSLAAAERGETNSTLDTRLYRWKTLLPEWEQSPVFGRGLGTTTTTESTSANRLNYLLPHNEYLRYLVETGVVGLAILLAALAILLRGLFRMRNVLGTPSAGTFNSPSLGIAIVLGCLVNSLADNTLLNSPTCYAAALIVAAVLAAPGVAMRRAPAPQAA
jgi:O-antigen ligase